MEPTFDIVIIEPNTKLVTPYKYLPKSYTIARFSSVNKSIDIMRHSLPRIVFVSASIGPSETVKFFELLKDSTSHTLPAILIIVDLSNPLSFIIGTSWAGKLAVTDSCISSTELYAVISRIL